MAIDFAATKEKMKLINKRAFLRDMAEKHPDDPPVNPEVLTMLLNGYYLRGSKEFSERGARVPQVLGYLREADFLVEIADDSKVAA